MPSCSLKHYKCLRKNYLFFIKNRLRKLLSYTDILVENCWQPEACDSQVEQLIGYALLAIFCSWKMKVRLIAINDNEKAGLCNQILDKSIGHADYLVNSDIVRRRQTDKHLVFFLFIDDMVSYNRHRTHPQRVT